MGSLVNEIIQVITDTPGLTDRQLTDTIRGNAAPQQPINQTARSMEGRGILVRKRRPDNLIGNYLSETAGQVEPPLSQSLVKNHDVDALSEDGIKAVLDRWLKASGWTTKVAWGKIHGIDIDASRSKERWIIEVKGPGSLQPMRVNYFIGILGETLQRMSDPVARYSIAFPDLAQYRNLWARLPELAKTRTGITLILVSKDGEVEVIEK